MAQQVWRGSISFGLVNVGGAGALGATRDQKVHFHQIDSRTGSRIGYDKVVQGDRREGRQGRHRARLRGRARVGTSPSTPRRSPRCGPRRPARSRSPTSSTSRRSTRSTTRRPTGWCPPTRRRRRPTRCWPRRWSPSSGSASAWWSCAPSSTWRRSVRCRARSPCRRCASPTRSCPADDVAGMPERVEPSDKELELATPDHHEPRPGSGTRAVPRHLHRGAAVADRGEGRRATRWTEEPESEERDGGQLVDLMAALEASVEAARAPRGAGADAADKSAEDRTA